MQPGSRAAVRQFAASPQLPYHTLALLPHLPQLQSIDVDTNMSGSYAADSVQLLQPWLAACPHLSRLRIKEKAESHYTAFVLSLRWLSCLTSLQALTLDCLTEPHDVVVHAPQLASLHMLWNPDQGCLAPLSMLTGLTDLQVRSCSWPPSQSQRLYEVDMQDLTALSRLCNLHLQGLNLKNSHSLQGFAYLTSLALVSTSRVDGMYLPTGLENLCLRIELADWEGLRCMPWHSQLKSLDMMGQRDWSHAHMITLMTSLQQLTVSPFASFEAPLEDVPVWLGKLPHLTRLALELHHACFTGLLVRRLSAVSCLAELHLTRKQRKAHAADLEALQACLPALSVHVS